jgi:hypothetical protein
VEWLKMKALSSSPSIEKKKSDIAITEGMKKLMEVGTSKKWITKKCSLAYTP